MKLLWRQTGRTIITIVSLVFLLWAPESAEAARSEEITDLEVIYQIDAQATLQVEEQIIYYTPLAKHGIYRYLPTKYDDGTEYDVHWLSVTDDRDARVPYEVQGNRNQTSIKIGDPDKTFTGTQSYVVKYEVPRALTEYETWYELYWDVAGEDWTFPIRQTRAIVESPAAKILEVACYSGAYGNDDGLCEVIEKSDHRVVFSYDHDLLAGQNMSIVVAIDKNDGVIIPALTTGEKILKWWQKYGSYVVGGLPIIMTLGAFLLVRAINKDDEIFVNDTQISLEPSGSTRKKPLFYKLPELMYYDPFIGKDFSPAEAGFLENLVFHYRMVVGEIFWLVERGYLEVEKVEPEKLGVWGKFKTTAYKGKDDFIFKRAKKTTNENEMKKLKSYQRDILDGLVGKSEETARFSAKVNGLAKKMNSLSEEVKKTMEKEGYLVKGTTWPLLVSLGVGTLFFFSGGLEFVWFGAMLAIIISSMGLGKYRLQKTALGNYYTSLGKGLKATIKSGKWYYEVQEKMMWIEAMLPFSMALGVTKELAEKMKDLANDPSEMAVMNRMTTNWLMIDMMNGSFERSMMRSFEKAFGDQYQAVTGSKSSGSGFSGGSGGGFSGGGGGGGGGGSW